MALSPEEETTLKRRLAEAEEALHQLATGRKRVAVRSATGEQSQYTPADEPRLRGYIREMKVKLGLVDRRSMAPIEILF